MQKYRHIIIVCTTLLLSVSALWAADIKAVVNTQKVIEGDAFQLTLITDGDTDTPDISPLEKDFIILGTSQSNSFRIVNGNKSVTNSWIFTLSPKKKGKITIPSINAGSVQTKPIEITVADITSASKLIGEKSGVNITVRLKGNGDKFYQFQEIPLTVRIEISSRVRDLQLSEPAVADVELQQIGKDRNSQVIRNGQRIEIIERDYIIRPQKLGSISLPPFALRGVAPDPNYRDPMAGFNRHFDDVFNDPFFNDPFFNNSQFGNRRSGKPFVRPSNSINFEVS
nr:BatD family protein [Gammaproteobacteria bacterium]